MKKKVLLIVESCNPELSSVPLVGYNFFRAIEKFADVHLVTHCRNREALYRNGVIDNVTYYDQTRLEIFYYKLIASLSTFRGRVIWPIRHALQFPIYFFFDRFVYESFSQNVQRGDYDIVHALTPIMPRYPYKLIKACRGAAKYTPFILGPVNGGVPYPKAFGSIGRKEFSYLNWIRKVGNWIVPGYKYTYSAADTILTGSTYTDSWLKDTFPKSADRMTLMYENGVSDAFYHNAYPADDMASQPEPNSSASDYNNEFRLLFIGRLEPYKGCDMLVEAVSGLNLVELPPIKLTIVGDGSQREELETAVKLKGLSGTIDFKGWVPHAEVPDQYGMADLFCFPSVREFGGAVVMEAMASGVPCIVVDNGGIGEYVTEKSGVKITPKGRDYVISKLQEKITELAHDRKLLQKMVVEAKERAKEFSWSNKSKRLAQIYDEQKILPAGEKELFH